MTSRWDRIRPKLIDLRAKEIKMADRIETILVLTVFAPLIVVVPALEAYLALAG
jgi:hypothetical protein